MRIPSWLAVAVVVISNFVGNPPILRADAATLYGCYASRGMTWASIGGRATEAAKYGIWDYTGTAAQNTQFASSVCPPSNVLGYGVITDYQKALSSPMTSTQTFVPVTSFTLKDGTTFAITDVGGKVFLTLEPGASKEEIVLCTAVDATLLRFTSCTRGLAFKGTSVSGIAANQKTHNSGSTVVISNVHYAYEQFVDTNAKDQTIGGVKTFSSFPIIATSTALPITDGQFATKKYVDNVGAGGFTASNVSSTLGLRVITSGIPDCPSSSTCVGISASSTGGIGFATSGHLQLDFNANWYLIGNATFTRAQLLGAPSADADATSKSYVDGAIGSGSVTGTTGVALSHGDALYISTTGTLFKTDTSAASSTFQFVGFSLGDYPLGTTARYTPPGLKNCAFSSLSAGYDYFLNGSGAQAGAIATTGSLSGLTYASSTSIRVGRAVSSSCLQVKEPKIIARGNLKMATSFTGNRWVETGFYPAKLELVALDDQSVNYISIGDDTNYSYQSATSTNANWSSVQGNAIRLQNGSGGTQMNGTVSSLTPTGFMLNVLTNVGIGLSLHWTAWGE